MADTFKTMLCAVSILWILSALLLASLAQRTAETSGKSQPPDVEKDVVCRSTEIRNNISGIWQLKNCTVVEGHVQILLIDLDDVAAFQAVSLPRLREITDYLLIYHVENMKTLSNIFPNLSVIRGRKLFFHFALVVYQMMSLEDLGLSSLALIERGAVCVENNPQLCYVDTIDWGRILPSTEQNRFFRNKNFDDCIYMYPQEITGCPKMNVAIGDRQMTEVPLCWNFDNCQKICPTNCSSGACYKTETEGVKCCHNECVGGCYGPTNADCFACKAIKYLGRCERRCPPHLYELSGWRCVTEDYCRGLQTIGARGELIPWITFIDNDRKLCLKECPSGYTRGINTTNHRCLRCPGPCPRICTGRIIDNIQAAESLEGCTIINGSLDLQIGVGNQIDLEKYLGEIQEVIYFVRIVKSFALTSLSFLRSLRFIHGVQRFNEYSLFIHENGNLNDIWDLETHPNLTIGNGSVFFVDNPKLCTDKIDNFITTVDVRNKPNGTSYFTVSSNGHRSSCQMSNLTLLIESVGPTTVTLKWDNNVQMKDTRYHIGWVVNYRPVPEGIAVTMDSGKEVCSDDVWTTVDVVNPQSLSVSIRDLQPFTDYTVYVKAYMISSDLKPGAISQLVFFRTLMSAPSPVKKLSINAVGTSDLQLTWVKPESPNGIITHYVVSWFVIKLDKSKFEKRDYCDQRIHYRKDSKTLPDESVVSDSELNGKCCQCPKSPKLIEMEQKERQFDITFENHLHNALYIKNTQWPPKVIAKRDVEAAKKKKRSVADETWTLSDTSTVAALEITSSTKWNPMNNNVREETRTLRRHQIRNSSIIIGNTSFTITGLGHFHEYWIEVIACHGLDSNVSGFENLCSKPAMTAARTNRDYNADNIDEETVSITRGQNETYLLQWSSPSNPNAIIVAFEIELSKFEIQNFKPDMHCITYKAYRELNGTRFDKVLSWGNWSCRVRALSLAGNGSWTSVQHFHLDGPEPTPSNLQHLLGALAVFPLIIILIAVISFFVIRYKRQFAFPEVISYNPEYINPEDLYVADGWEVKREQVTVLDALGQGSFGMVYHGLFRESEDEEDKEPVPVAVKTVMELSSLRDRIAFLHEASVMKAFNSYHVVKLLGIVSKGQPSLVVMELMSNGDLKTFLRRHRPDELENEGVQPPPLQLILQMAGEIADGMAYLVSRKFVHRDLAARNCMVSDNLTVKIGDFGLTRDIYATDYYRKNTKGLLPVRWMAPESLKDGVFTLHSDVWSFGIVLWEMATLATQPYQGLSNEEVLHYVIDGGKMTIPEKCPGKLVNLMSMCWDSTPKRRPTFEEVIEILLPDLNSNFSVVSYYFTRTEDECVDDMEDKEEEQEREEEEQDENSKTPLSISFAPIRSGPQSMGQREALPNGLSPRLGQGTNCEPNTARPVLEPFETDEDFSRSSSYPGLQPGHEGQSSISRHGQIRSSVKSAVNLLACLATSSRPAIGHTADVKRSDPDKMQHKLVSL